jgi:hypothetical protein
MEDLIAAKKAYEEAVKLGPFVNLAPFKVRINRAKMRISTLSKISEYEAPNS